MESISISGLDLISTKKRKRIRAIVEQIAAWDQKPNEMLSVCFVDNDHMCALQKQWKHKDETTDVLSFPAHGQASIMPGTEHMLGDIAICVDQAHKQAEEFGHTFEEEVGVLMAHGLLHLLGFDHEENEDQALMQMQGEMTILDTIGFSPALSLLGRAFVS